MLGRVPKRIEDQTLNFISEYPTYGSERTEAELKSVGISLGHAGIYNILKNRYLNRAKARLEWVRKLSGEIVTLDEITRVKEKAENNHVEADYPGQLIGRDTFHIARLKEIGRIYHQVACDCFSSFGAANICDNKATKVSTDVVGNHLAKKVPPGKIQRIFTDSGAKYTPWHEEAIPTHEFEKT